MPKKCPECGKDLTGLDKEALKGHANDHWPLAIPDKDLGKDAVERRNQVLEGGVETEE